MYVCRGIHYQCFHMKVNKCITFIIHIIIMYGCTSKALHTYTHVIFTTCMLRLVDRKMLLSMLLFSFIALQFYFQGFPQNAIACELQGKA